MLDLLTTRMLRFHLILRSRMWNGSAHARMRDPHVCSWERESGTEIQLLWGKCVYKPTGWSLGIPFLLLNRQMVQLNYTFFVQIPFMSALLRIKKCHVVRCLRCLTAYNPQPTVGPSCKRWQIPFSFWDVMSILLEPMTLKYKSHPFLHQRTHAYLHTYITYIHGVQLKSGPLTKPWIYHVRCYL